MDILCSILYSNPIYRYANVGTTVRAKDRKKNTSLTSDKSSVPFFLMIITIFYDCILNNVYKLQNYKRTEILKPFVFFDIIFSNLVSDDTVFKTISKNIT